MRADRARLYNAEGTLAAQRGQKNKAIGFYDKAIAETPGMLEAVHNKALISPPDQKEKLLVQNRGYLNSRIELAQMLKRQGRVAEAIPEYEGILAQRDDFAGAHLDLAQLYLRDAGRAPERVTRATAQLDKAVRAQPGFWKVYLVKAEIARVQRHEAEAKLDYKEARRRASDREAKSEISKSEKTKWAQ